MKKILSLVVLAFLISCSNEGNIQNKAIEIENFYPKSYHFKYMDYGNSTILNPSLDNLVKLNYDSNNKLIKRIGGIISLGSGSGFSTMYTNEIYDDLVYLNNEIQIIRKTSSTSYSIYSFERKLLLDNQNRIIKKTTYQQNANPTNDTINYTYNSLGLIDRATKGDLNLYNEESKFYYNHIQNLDSIVTKRFYQNEPYYSKDVEVFSNYDNVSNPLKKLIIFEETFSRAISKNNYSKYEKYKYDSYNNLINHEIINWNLHYDDFGHVKFELY